MLLWFFAGVCLVLCGSNAMAQERFSVSRCEIVPLPEHQASFRVDGVERTRWYFGDTYPRPFLFPVLGPSGSSLTRMGHPGAPNHDHHRSVWLAHHDVGGVDFWSDLTQSQIRQKSWRVYRDGDNEAIMASVCGWFDSQQHELLEQDVVVAIVPLPEGELAIEFCLTMRPGGDRKSTMLGRTNFGFLAVRVAKTLSIHFGGGKLTGSGNQNGEGEIFGKRLHWVDYSGPVACGRGPDRKTVIEGITFFDHPDNPRFPTHWHVREDGWMGASFCMQQEYDVVTAKPLVLRYLLYVHRGACSMSKAEKIETFFARRPGLVVVASTRPHQQYDVSRIGTAD